MTVELPAVIKGRDGRMRSAKQKPRRNPCIAVTTAREAQKATEACQRAGADSLPAKIINLKRLTHIASEKEAEDRRQQHHTDLKEGNAELLLGIFVSVRKISKIHPVI